MKEPKNIPWIKVLLTAAIIPFLLSQCSTSGKAVKFTSAEIRNMVDSSRFVFVAERMSPLRGASRYLTSTYEVVVKKDSLDCYLPFFGRAFQAPLDPSKGGIQFSSTNFEYKFSSKNGNQWDVILKPRDYPDVQQLYFNIFDNGTANLSIVNTHRDPISYDGHIEKVGK